MLKSTEYYFSSPKNQLQSAKTYKNVRTKAKKWKITNKRYIMSRKLQQKSVRKVLKNMNSKAKGKKSEKRRRLRVKYQSTRLKSPVKMPIKTF